MIYPEDYTGLFFETTTTPPDGATAAMMGVTTLRSAFDPQNGQVAQGPGTLSKPEACGAFDIACKLKGSLQETVSYSALGLLGVLLIVVGLFIVLKG